MGIFTNAADAGSAGRNGFEDCGVGVAAIEGEYQGAVFAAGILIERVAQTDHLLCAAQAKTGIARIETILLPDFGSSIVFGLRRCGGMEESNGSETKAAVVAGQGGGQLEKALAAHEVGLKTRAEGIAPPCHAGGMKTGAAQQSIVHDGAKRGSWGKFIGDGAADDGKHFSQRKTIAGEQTKGGAPVLELRAGSGEQTSHGMSSETEQRTQREGLRAVGDAALVEEGEALVPESPELREDTGRVFFRTVAGASGRRSASRVLSSTSHSTVSPRKNSMA